MQEQAAASEAPAAADAGEGAAAPPTPLERRQWQRLAQRAVRLAVTAFKDATARFTDAISLGTTAATQLTNSLLSQRYIPDTQLPEVLQQVRGLQQAAVAKLHRRQVQQLVELQRLLEVMQAAVQDMQAVVANVGSQLSPADAVWQHHQSVFHTLGLPDTVGLLQQVLDMHQQELAVKQGLVDSFSQAVEDGTSIELRSQAQDSSSSGGVAGGSSSGMSMLSAAGSSKAGKQKALRSTEDLRRQLTAAVTTWMVRPCIEDDQVAQLLQVLTDEMVGY